MIRLLLMGGACSRDGTNNKQAIRNTTRVYPKVSGLAAWSENCKWYNSLPLVQLYRYFVSQSSEFCRHNPFCCFSTSVCCCLFRYRLSPETFGYILVHSIVPPHPAHNTMGTGGKKLITHLHLVLRLGMRGAISPLPNTSSWRVLSKTQGLHIQLFVPRVGCTFPVHFLSFINGVTEFSYCSLMPFRIPPLRGFFLSNSYNDVIGNCRAVFRM
jgi:hypothetical protein